MARSFDLDLQNRWLQLMQDWQRSDCSIRQFCKRRHLPESKFFFWRRTLQKRGLLADISSTTAVTAVPSSTPAFVPLLLEPPSPVAVLELVLANGRVLRIAPGFDPRALAELLALLEKMP